MVLVPPARRIRRLLIRVGGGGGGGVGLLLSTALAPIRRGMDFRTRQTISGPTRGALVTGISIIPVTRTRSFTTVFVFVQVIVQRLGGVGGVLFCLFIYFVF